MSMWVGNMSGIICDCNNDDATPHLGGFSGLLQTQGRRVVVVLKAVYCTHYGDFNVWISWLLCNSSLWGGQGSTLTYMMEDPADQY